MPAGDSKHRAKRFNEGAKIVATLFNSLAIITIGTAFIGPIARRRYDVLVDGVAGGDRFTSVEPRGDSISSSGGMGGMTQAYAYQILGIVIAMGVFDLGGLFIFS